jgi:glucan phosphoethanolaminetransferase (alkaline phosphatase superfamily)
MNKAAKIAAIVLGVVSVICAGLGLFYNTSSVFTSFSGAFQKLVDDEKLSHFYPAFYTMSAVCVACYLLLFFCGVEFLRSRFRFVWLFVSVLAFEVIYFFSIGVCWLIPGLGHSIGAATGVANGGLMVQFLILFPLWGAVLAFWTKRRFERSI